MLSRLSCTPFLFQHFKQKPKRLKFLKKHLHPVSCVQIWPADKPQRTQVLCFIYKFLALWSHHPMWCCSPWQTLASLSWPLPSWKFGSILAYERSRPDSPADPSIFLSLNTLHGWTPCYSQCGSWASSVTSQMSILRSTQSHWIRVCILTGPQAIPGYMPDHYTLTSATG